MDPGSDSTFYTSPRFVTHIDDNAINNLRKYYDDVLPRKGRILDFCSSWISHYPPEVVKASETGELEVLGTGMNKAELSRNSVLKAWCVQDLNEDPDVRLPGDVDGVIDASTCVVSVDYLTKPVEVLRSIRQRTNPGGKVHLIISNRCFPTKAVGRWLKVDEDERLDMVGDYLWWSGWRNIEIQTLVEGTWMKDPLWVVRAEKTATDG
jgi:SAM-dependent methyltransferase